MPDKFVVFKPLMNLKVFCQNCNMELRQDIDGEWIDCETHTVCESGIKHIPTHTIAQSSGDKE